jgi:hypothetical protein
VGAGAQGEVDQGGAVVECRAAWRYNGKPDSLVAKIAVRLNAGMGADAAVGVGNIAGAALGGFLIGLVETLVVGYSKNIGIPPGFRDAVAFVILILILMFKPAGLLGKSEREKV